MSHSPSQFDVLSLINQINNQSIIPSTDAIQLTLTLKMTTAQVGETSVTVNNNSPVQDYVQPDDQTQPTFGPEIVTLQGQLIFFPAFTVSDHRSSNFWETCLPGIAVISWSMSDFFMGLSLSSASSVLDTIS